MGQCLVVLRRSRCLSAHGDATVSNGTSTRWLSGWDRSMKLYEAHWQSSTRRCHARHSFMLRNFWSVASSHSLPDFAWLQCRCQFTELSSILCEFASHCRSIFKVAQLQCADCGPLQSKLRRTKAGIDGGIHG